MAVRYRWVASDVDGIKEVIFNGENGILVPPKNPESIANAIIQLIEDPQLVKKLVENGKKRAQMFDVHEHVSKLDRLYSNLLGDNITDDKDSLYFGSNFRRNTKTRN